MFISLNSTQEFIAEAKADREQDALTEKVVRVSFAFQQIEGGMMTRVSLVAGYLRYGILVELRDVLGEELTDRIRAEGLSKMWEELRKRLEHVLQETGYSIRRGMFHP